MAKRKEVSRESSRSRRPRKPQPLVSEKAPSTQAQSALLVRRPTKISRHFDSDPLQTSQNTNSPVRSSWSIRNNSTPSVNSEEEEPPWYTTPLKFDDESRRSAPLTAENLRTFEQAEPLWSVPHLQPSFSVAAKTSQSSESMLPRKSKSKSPKKEDRKKSKSKEDPNSHPLNLPPDELRRLSAAMAREEARQSMSVDPESSEQTNGGSQPDTPIDTPGAFPTDTNGDTNGHQEDDKSPTPPPHKPQPKVDPEACKAAGNKYFKSKDFDRAIEEYTKAVEADPSNPTYLSNRAAAYMSANKYDEALNDSLQANLRDPGNVKILHRLARIYTSLGRPQDALDTYEKIPDASATDTAAARKALQSVNMAKKQIEDEDGNGNVAVWNLDQAKQTLGYGSPMPRTWQILRAKAYLKSGTTNALGEVQAIANAMTRQNGQDAEALTLAGRAFYLRDDKSSIKSDYARAEECWRQALSLDPDASDARNWLRTMKKLDRARTEANDVFKRGRYSDAVKLYTDCLSIDLSNKITNAKILGNRALSHMKLKEFDEAKADCDQALKLDPTYSKAKRTRAKCVGEAGDWDQAVKDLKSLNDENPGDAELARELRNAELELKKSKRKDYYKILGVDKDAGDKDIERAYKRKAAVLHPDKTQGDKQKEEQFKDCLEAKENLLDPQKRQLYDSGADLNDPMSGMGGGFPGGFGGGMGGGGGGGMQIDPEMLFQMFGGMQGGGGRGFPGGGGGGFPGGAQFSFGGGGPGMGGRGGQGGFPFG